MRMTMAVAVVALAIYLPLSGALRRSSYKAGSSGEPNTGAPAEALLEVPPGADLSEQVAEEGGEGDFATSSSCTEDCEERKLYRCCSNEQHYIETREDDWKLICGTAKTVSKCR